MTAPRNVLTISAFLLLATCCWSPGFGATAASQEETTRKTTATAADLVREIKLLRKEIALLRAAINSSKDVMPIQTSPGAVTMPDKKRRTFKAIGGVRRVQTGAFSTALIQVPQRIVIGDAKRGGEQQINIHEIQTLEIVEADGKWSVVVGATDGRKSFFPLEHQYAMYLDIQWDDEVGVARLPAAQLEGMVFTIDAAR